MNTSKCLKISGLTGLLFFMLITGCSTTHQMRDAKTSGFLGDYSMLREGKDEEALLVYIDPEVNFNQYKKVILEPVKMIASEDSDMAKVDREDAKRMADYFYTALYQSLQRDYQMVNEPGPNTMRIRVALTDITGSKVALDTVGTILPIGLALSTIKRVATGTHLSVGKASGEIEILDSKTGMRLGAAVDARAGKKITGKLDKFEKWNDAKGACDHWAERIRLRLEELSDAGYILHGVE
jgi:hypothetical protein